MHVERTFLLTFSSLVASNLPETELGSILTGNKQDPYVRLSLGEADMCSSWKNGAGTYCEWGEEEVVLSVKESDLYQGHISLQVWNENQPAPDILIGKASYPVDGLLDLAVPAWDLDSVPIKVEVHRPLSRPLFGLHGALQFDLRVEEKRLDEQEYVLYFTHCRATKMPETESGPSALVGGKQDPYLKIIVGHGPRARTVESSVKWGAGSNAHWLHEVLELRLTETQLKTKDITFQVGCCNSTVPHPGVDGNITDTSTPYQHHRSGIKINRLPTL